MSTTSALGAGDRPKDDLLTSAELKLIGQAILEHLWQESTYLDSVIECSMKMSHLLSQSSYASQTDHDSESSPREPATSAHQQLNQLKQELTDSFEPVAAGRQQLQAALRKLEPFVEGTPTLRDLVPSLDLVTRDELEQLRIEIKRKIHDVQAMTLSNQAVLIYTLDFYHRLMTGITGESTSSKSYNAHGQTIHQSSTHLLEKQC